MNEAQTTIINLKTNLADSNRETTETNTHYKQLLLENATVNVTKTNLEAEIQKIQAPTMAAEALENLITALNRREDVQAISSFSGNATDQYISSWLSEAEAIATIHNWDDAVKKTNFASRLKGPALKWHSQRATSHPNENYTQWKQALKDHFKHPADRDKQLQKLENLTQNPKQSVRMFIDKINNTYNSIYDDTNNQNLSI